MSWIAEYDTHGREFPACVHVTKTTNSMTHGATYVPIEDGKAVRDENARLRELCAEMYPYAKAFLKEGVMLGCIDSKSYDWFLQLREMGVDV